MVETVIVMTLYKQYCCSEMNSAVLLHIIFISHLALFCNVHVYVHVSFTTVYSFLIPILVFFAKIHLKIWDTYYVGMADTLKGDQEKR